MHYYPPQAPVKTLIFGKAETNERIKDDLLFLRDQGCKNDWEVVLNLLRAEVRELEAMEDAFRMKAHYEGLKAKAMATQKECNDDLQALRSGKKTLKSFLSTKKNDEIMTDLQRTIDHVLTLSHC
jgi:hypothetical protein